MPTSFLSKSKYLRGLPEIMLVLKNKKTMRFSNNQRRWSVALSSGDHRGLNDFDEVVDVIQKIIG